MSARRVVLLSTGDDFSRDLLAVLVARRAGVAAHLVYRNVHGRPPPHPARRLLEDVRALRRRFDPRLRAGAEETFFTGALNAPRMIRDLERLRPDVVVLARCALLGPRLLEIPSEGVVNVHPGLLPWIRGSNPFTHTLLRGVPLGCTAFRVDAGIDTGPLLERRLLRISGSESVAELRSALRRLWIEMTADLVQRVRVGIPMGVAQTSRSPLCRALPHAVPPEAADAVASGVPFALFQRWSALCDGERLPLDADPPPLAGAEAAH